MAEVAHVQFRGLSSQYKAQDSIEVSYRYAIGGEFEASPQDLVGVFTDGATSGESALVSVSIEDPATHRLCDGGLYKTGSVALKFPAEVEKGDHVKYRFWYISSKTGQPEGRSDIFTLCANDAEYLTISFESVDVSSAARTRSISASYVDIGETFSSAASTPDLSFVVIEEGSSCEVPGSQYVMTQTGDASETMINGETVGDTRDNDSTGERSSADDITTQAQCGKDGDELTFSMPHSISSSTIPEDCVKCLPFDDSSPAFIAPQSIKSAAAAEVMVAPEPAEIGLSSQSGTSSGIEVYESTGCYDVGLKSSSTSDLPSSSPTLPLECADIAEMSSSTVIVEKHVTQREARVLKTSNKELRSKVQKLAEILEQKKIMIDGLVKKASESEKQLLEVQVQEKMFEAVKRDLTGNVSSLERQLKEQIEREQEHKRRIQALEKQVEENEIGRKEAERLNKELLYEKGTLEEKVKRLLQENKTMFERSTKLLTQLLDSETKREVERSEKKVLQGKIDYLGAELRRFKLSEAKGNVKQQHGAGTSTMYESTALPPTLQEQHHLYTERPRQNAERALREEYIFVPSSRVPPATSNARPNELPLRAAATAHNSRIGQTGRGEHPKHNRGLPNSRHQHLKQAMVVNGHDVASIGQEVPLSKSGQRKFAGPTLEGRDDHLTLQEGSFAGGGRRGVGGATRGELETLAPDPTKGGMAPPAKRGVVTVECPICGKQLPSGGNDFGALLHVEQCIQLSETTNH